MHVWRTMGHWAPHPSWASCWAKMSGFPTSSPMLSWLNHMGCFPLPCLGPLSSSWLRHHWSLSRDTHPPAPWSQVLLGMWLFLECSVTVELWLLIPSRRICVDEFPPRGTSVRLQALNVSRRLCVFCNCFTLCTVDKKQKAKSVEYNPSS